jgi:hypothetical protein
MKGTFLSALGWALAGALSRRSGTRSFSLAKITEIRFNPQNGEIKLLAGPRKLSIEFRFGVNTILNEVVQRTGLQPATQ